MYEKQKEQTQMYNVVVLYRGNQRLREDTPQQNGKLCLCQERAFGYTAVSSLETTAVYEAIILRENAQLLGRKSTIQNKKIRKTDPAFPLQQVVHF